MHLGKRATSTASSSIRIRRRLTAIAAAALVTTQFLTAPSAHAEPSPPNRDVPISGGISGRAATALAARLGLSRTGGVHLDRGSGRIVVPVTDDAAAKEVLGAGGIAERVAYSTAHLDSIKQKLNESARIPGTTWGTDPSANQVIVAADRTVSDEDYQRLTKLTKPYGTAVSVSRTTGVITPTINGGRYIVSDDGVQCSLGFNVRKKSDPDSKYFVTAGHCTVGATGVSDWYDAGGTYIGYDAGGFFPENDFGLVRHYNANISKEGNVYLHNGTVQDITHSRDAYVDEYICRSGYRTGVTCGYVEQRGVTVNYAEGTVYGLFSTTACIQGGDSGGAVFHGDAALGLVSGMDTSGCRSYMQPVNEALAWYDVEVY